MSRGGPALDARPYSAWGVRDDWAAFLIDISVRNLAGRPRRGKQRRADQLVQCVSGGRISPSPEHAEDGVEQWIVLASVGAVVVES